MVHKDCKKKVSRLDSQEYKIAVEKKRAWLRGKKRTLDEFGGK